MSWFYTAMQREPVVMWSCFIGGVGARPSAPSAFDLKNHKSERGFFCPLPAPAHPTGSSAFRGRAVAGARWYLRCRDREKRSTNPGDAHPPPLCGRGEWWQFWVHFISKSTPALQLMLPLPWPLPPCSPALVPPPGTRMAMCCHSSECSSPRRSGNSKKRWDRWNTFLSGRTHTARAWQILLAPS